jgi:hypothetical protein
MIGRIIKARKEGRPLVTVAICVPSAADKKGGFATIVKYRNRQTGKYFSQIEFREISEFPAKGNAGFKAIKIPDDREKEFYTICQKNGWFIEDIFSGKKVAFNIAFYALDIKLLLARMFDINDNLDEVELIKQLQNIDEQVWVDRINEIGNNVPVSIKPDKKVPNEDNTDCVVGYITEQTIQDLIVNGLRLLSDTEKELQVDILLSTRKDIFLPYKGTTQAVLDEHGEIIEGEPHRYDLLANMQRYAGIIKELSAKGHYCILNDENERIIEVYPVYNIEDIQKANKFRYHLK